MPKSMDTDSRHASSSTFSTTSSAADGKIERKKVTHSRRSSSPFEVKLTPTVSKRVSLDAFGGTPAPVAEGAGHEEVLDDISDMDEESLDDPVQDSVGEMPDWPETSIDVVATFHGTTLSTINEVSGDHSDVVGHPGPEPSRYWTPSGTPAGRENVSTSPMLPSRQHRSTPPFSSPRRNLLQAHEDHTTALDNELRASMTLISELQAESRRLQDALEEESEDKRQVLLDIGQVQRELVQAKHALHSRDTSTYELHCVVYGHD